MAIVERPEPAKRESAERPIRIFLNEVPVAVSQGSPFGLSELAVGYLLSEGLIADRDSLVEVVEVPEEAAVYVASGERAEEGYVPLHRVTSAGCAQSALLRDARRAGEPRALESAARFDADDLLACMEELCERSPRRNTGACVHGCGLGAAGSDELLLVREDIGRHNALDKVLGWALEQGIPLGECIVYTSGRIPVDMVLKVIRAGVPVFASKAMPTAESVALAKEFGLTLIGAARVGSMVLF